MSYAPCNTALCRAEHSHCCCRHCSNAGAVDKRDSTHLHASEQLCMWLAHVQCYMQVGWSTTLATADRRPFVARLHEAKQKHLKEMVLMGEIPLRTGACRRTPTLDLLPYLHISCTFLYYDHLASQVRLHGTAVSPGFLFCRNTISCGLLEGLQTGGVRECPVKLQPSSC